MDHDQVSTSSDVSRRALVHAALGDPHRLAMVDLLCWGHATPSELGQAVGLPSNLVAHHLQVLEEAGLLARSASAGDGRRRYVQLRRDHLEQALQLPVMTASAVLFVCHHNAARSQLAAVLWNRQSSIPASSAGLEPARRVHPEAVRLASRHGLDLLAARPRSFEDVERVPDLVISVCDITHEARRPFATARHLHWSIHDPSIPGKSKDFETAFQRIAAHVADVAPRVYPRDQGR